MTFQVRMLRRANADFANIVAYLHERSPQGAAAWVNAFEKAKVRLSENADCCPEADENHRHAIEVRQALFKTRRGRIYRLVFTIVDDEVRILRIRGSGQAQVEPRDI